MHEALRGRKQNEVGYDKGYGCCSYVDGVHVLFSSVSGCGCLVYLKSNLLEEGVKELFERFDEIVEISSGLYGSSVV